MSDEQPERASRLADVLLASDHEGASRPIWLVRDPAAPDLSALTPEQRTWLTATAFSAQPKRHALLPGPDGSIAAILYGIGQGDSGEPTGPGVLLVGQLPSVLPRGTYHLADALDLPELAAIAWALGAYRFRRYKTGEGEAVPRLKLPAGAEGKRVTAIAEGVWLGRDLINTPASDMGPAELEAAARQLG